MTSPPLTKIPRRRAFEEAVEYHSEVALNEIGLPEKMLLSGLILDIGTAGEPVNILQEHDGAVVHPVQLGEGGRGTSRRLQQQGPSAGRGHVIEVPTAHAQLAPLHARRDRQAACLKGGGLQAEPEPPQIPGGPVAQSDSGSPDAWPA